MRTQGENYNNIREKFSVTFWERKHLLNSTILKKEWKKQHAIGSETFSFNGCTHRHTQGDSQSRLKMENTHNFKLTWRKTSKELIIASYFFQFLSLSIELIPSCKNIIFRCKSVCKIFFFEMTHPLLNNYKRCLVVVGHETWSVRHFVFLLHRHDAIHWVSQAAQ